MINNSRQKALLHNKGQKINQQPINTRGINEVKTIGELAVEAIDNPNLSQNTKITIMNGLIRQLGGEANFESQEDFDRKMRDPNFVFRF